MSSRRRRAPSYLVLKRGRLHGRFRYVDTGGRVSWPCKPSPFPGDLRRSTTWAATWRLDWIREREGVVRQGEELELRGPTLGEILDAYEDQARGRNAGYPKERSRIQVIRATLGASTPVLELTPARVRAWLEELRASRGRKRRKESRRPLAPRSQNAYLADLKAALNLALEEARIPANPIASLRPIAEPYRQPEAMSVDQVAAIFAALDDYEAELRSRPGRPAACPLRGIVLAHYFTTQRTGSVLRLRWSAVDLKRGVVTFLDSKTRRRAVARIRPPLREYLEAREPGRRADAWVFPNPATGLPYVDVRKQWRRLLELANQRLAKEDPPGERIPAGRRLYAFRHSAFSHLLAAGMAPQAVAQQGATSLRMLSRHYAHLFDEAVLAEADRAALHPDQRELEAAARGSKIGSKRGQKPPQTPRHNRTAMRRKPVPRRRVSSKRKG